MNATGIPTISPRDAAVAAGLAGDRMPSDDPSTPLIVDVREPDEFAADRIAGVVLLPMSQLLQRHDELPKDRPLLMVCRSGSRSASATMFLLQRGWTDVQNVDGGMLAWQRDGLPVRSGPPAEGEGEPAV
jgi:rhodanese-related sulfurtransferase